MFCTCLFEFCTLPDSWSISELFIIYNAVISSVSSKQPGFWRSSFWSRMSLQILALIFFVKKYFPMLQHGLHNAKPCFQHIWASNVDFSTYWVCGLFTMYIFGLKIIPQIVTFCNTKSFSKLLIIVRLQTYLTFLYTFSLMSYEECKVTFHTQL